MFSTLEREWTRLYADFLNAEAVYSDYNWQRVGLVPATWIADAMDEPWLTNEAGKRKAANSLAVRTPATEAIHGDDRDRYARELDRSNASSPIVRALHIETDPEVSELVEQLLEIRERGDVPESQSGA